MQTTDFKLLREKAGDGSTDFIVEIWQADLTRLLDAAALGDGDKAGRHVCGPEAGNFEQLRAALSSDDEALAALARLEKALS